MAVVRITIKKTLIQSANAHRQSTTDSFSSEYLVRTNAAFPSPQLRAYATGIAQAESRLYWECVRFDGATVKLATPGASSEALRGQHSQVDLDKLRGQLSMGEDEMLAFPPVTAVYSREAQWGRHGRLLLPHALTTREWNLYTHQQVRPLRFHGPGGSAPPPLSAELVAAIRAEGGTFVMAGTEGDTEGSLRKINSFFFEGFQVSSLKTKKRKSSLAAKKAAQRRALLLGESEAVNQSPGASRSAGAKVPVAGIVYLLKAGPHFKIGKTINFQKRLGQIKLLLPDPVEVVHTIRAANPSAVENHWHRRFASLRRGGEWFVLSEADVAEFKSVSQM